MKNTETIEETNAQPTTKIVYRDIKIENMVYEAENRKYLV